VSYADTKMEEAAQQQTNTESTRARRRFRRPSNHSRGLEDEWNFEVLAFHPKDRGPMLVRLRIMDSPSYWRRATTESYEDGTFKDGWFELLERHEVEGLLLQPRALPRLTWEESAAPAQIWGQTGWDGIQAPSAKPPPRKKRAAKK
jgi:hypothetical protein